MSTCILAQRRGLWVNKISGMHCATLQCCVPNKEGVCLSIFSSAGFGTRFEQTLQTRASAKAKWGSLRCSWQNRGQANLKHFNVCFWWLCWPSLYIGSTFHNNPDDVLPTLSRCHQRNTLHTIHTEVMLLLERKN